MTDPLSIDELLKWLDVSLIDANIYERCVEAERLCRRRESQRAVYTARAAASLAVATGQPLAIGIAFLYLAVVRHSSSINVEREAAPIDGNTALGWLKRNDHQWVIAILIQARILLNDGRNTAALEYYQQAAPFLIQLARRSANEKQSTQERHYWELQRAVTHELQRVQLNPPVNKPPSFTNGQTAGRYTRDSRYQTPIDLNIPAHIIWPDSGAIGVGILPPQDGSAPDFLEIKRLALRGRLFSVQPIDATLPDEAYRMRPRQVYAFLQIETDQPGPEDECYVIVRRQDRPDQNRQYVVVVDATNQQAWVDVAESTAPHVAIHIIGLGREWNVRDGSEAELDDDQLRVFGVVEAILRVEPDGAARA